MASTPVPPMPILPYPPEERPFRYCVQMALPAVYGDELDFYSLLAKVVKQLNDLIASNNMLNEDMKTLYEFVEQLRNIMDEFMATGFDDYYKQQVVEWINGHLTWLFTTIARSKDTSQHISLMDGRILCSTPERTTHWTRTVVSSCVGMRTARIPSTKHLRK